MLTCKHDARVVHSESAVNRNKIRNKKRPEHLFPEAQGRICSGRTVRSAVPPEFGNIPWKDSPEPFRAHGTGLFSPIPFSVTGEPGEAYFPSGDGFGPRLREGFGTSSAKAFTGRLLSAASEMLTVSFQRLFVKKE